MNEAQPRATSKRDDHRVDDTIDRRICGRQRLVHDRPVVEVVRIILASIPGHTRALGVFTIQATHSSTLAPPQLLKTQLRHVLTGETHQVHVACDGQPHRRIAHRASLRLQQP